MNVKQWINDYYSIYKKLDLKPGTLRSYLTCLYRIPDEWDVENLSSTDIQKLINSLASELSPSTVRHIFLVLKTAIIDGVNYGLPNKAHEFINIKLPKNNTKIIKSLDNDQINALMPYLQQSSYCHIFLFLLNTGMRIGELIALDCSDFDISKHTIKIQKDFYRGEIQSTKTKSSVREIPLNDVAYKIALNSFRLGSSKLPLFVSKKNKRLSYNTIITNWHSILDKSNISKCGVHVLRHTFATRMLENDIQLKIVSHILGHKSISITADIYTDVPLYKMFEAVKSLNCNQNDCALMVL